jgi:hypothetical protein
MGRSSNEGRAFPDASGTDGGENNKMSPPGSLTKTDCSEIDMNAKGTYTVKKWEESVYQQLTPEKKMTKASVEYGFSGEIEGTGLVEYLMFYSHSDPKDQHKSSASYVGLIYFDGTILGKSGSLVLEDNGTFEGGTAKSTLRIAKGSGSGQLDGIDGNGAYHANQDGYTIELEFNLK